MRLVLDTNVLVSALLHEGRTPDVAIALASSRGARVLLDDRIEREYRDVLTRAKFRSVPEARRDALLARVLAESERVIAAPYDGVLLDADDRCFVEVARGGGADAIVTGNVRHFPAGIGIAVWTPAELRARLELSG